MEKELKARDELRASHAELLTQHQSQSEQLTLLNGVFANLETKHMSLEDEHAALKTNFEAAQIAIETLQDDVNQMQTKLIHSGSQQQRFAEYEVKIQTWERKYLDMERKYTDRDHRVQILTQEVKSLLENKEDLEKEVSSAHDQMIRMNGLVKTMEAKLEASLQGEHSRVDLEAVSRLIWCVLSFPG